MSNSLVSAMLRVSLENEDVSEELTDEQVDAVADETPETEVTDVVESEQEVDAADTASDELEDAAEGLEALRASMESSLAAGGLTKEAARFANIAANSYTKRLGLSSSIMPSMESFGASDRLEATKISMEGIGETLKKIWEAIKSLAQRVWNAIVNFFKSIFGAAERLERRAKALDKLAGKLTGDAKKSKITVSARLASRIALGDKVDASANGAKDLVKAIETCAKFDLENNQATAKFVEEFRGLMGKTAKIADGAEWLKARAPKMVEGLVKRSTSGVNAVWATAVVPGNVSFQVSVRQDDNTVSSVDRVPTGKSIEKDVEVDTLKPDDISKVAKAALDIVSISKRVSADNKAKKIELGNMPTNNVGEEDAGVKRLIAIRLQRAVALQGKLRAKAAAHGVNTAAAYLDIAAKSAKQYGKAAE